MEAAGWKSFPGEKRESEGGESRPDLSEARFRRLLQTEDGEAKVSAFVRLIAILGGTINIPALTNDFLLWNHPDLGDAVRERWAFHYYHAYAGMPASLTTDSEDSAE